MAPRGLNPPRSDQPISRTYHVGRRVWPPNVGSDPGVVALVEELHRRAIRVTRMAFNPDLWGPALRRLDADGRTIRLGWFRDLDRQLLNVTGELSRGRLDFLMVPRTRRRPPQSMPSRRPPTVPTGRHRPSCSTCSAPQVRPCHPHAPPPTSPTLRRPRPGTPRRATCTADAGPTTPPDHGAGTSSVTTAPSPATVNKSLDEGPQVQFAVTQGRMGQQAGPSGWSEAPGGRGPLRRGLFLVWPASRSQSAIERSGADGEPASPEHHSDRE